ncbi:hypothetical protein ABS764_08155 [Flavobacterium sp. ST-87]|uniref:Uncharacterized protein n=1 Tax=Flavobacterium plantiphilum TaxID=3163297 RepID=A0ABW8XSF5_9FLAO
MIITIKKIIFWFSIMFIILSILSLTIVQKLPYEFADIKVQNHFYDTIIFGLPFAILLTLFGTLKKENSNPKNWTFGILTVLTSAICFIGQLYMIFAFGFGYWTTTKTIFKHRKENLEIKEQLYDIGAFGYGGFRIVETKPFMYFWILPTPIDTATINKKEWKFVNKEGNIKFP